MMWRVWSLAAAALALCSCGTAPAPSLARVQIPVAVSCASPAPTRPTLADSDAALKAAPDIFEKTKLLLAGRAQRDGYIAELEASRAGCP